MEEDQDPVLGQGHQLEALGVSPAVFVNDVINAVNEYCADGFDALERYVQAHFPAKDAASKESLTQGIDGIYGVLQASADRNLAEFENFVLKECFAIPQGLVIPEQVQTPQRVSGEDEVDIDAKLEALQQKLIHEQSVLGRLRRDLRAIEREIDRANGPAKTMQTLLVSGAADSNGESIVDAAREFQRLLQRAEMLQSSR